MEAAGWAVGVDWWRPRTGWEGASDGAREGSGESDGATVYTTCWAGEAMVEDMSWAVRGGCDGGCSGLGRLGGGIGSGEEPARSDGGGIELDGLGETMVQMTVLGKAMVEATG